MKEILLKNQSKNLEYIPLSEAGHILNTSRDYMNVLVRRGKLHAIKLGRNWFTTSEWLSEYQRSVGKKSEIISELKKIEEFSEIEKADLSVDLSAKALASAEVLAKAEQTELKNLKEKLIIESAFTKATADKKELTERLERIESKIESMSSLKGPKISTFKDLEISKKAASFIASQEIELPARQLGSEEKSKILESAFAKATADKAVDVSEFQNVSKKLGISKSLKSWSHLKFSLVSGAVILITVISVGIFSGSIPLPKTNLSFIQQGINQQEKYLAAIFSDVFNNFLNDLPVFSQWLASGLNKSISLFKSKSSSELAIETLESGKSKLLKPEEAPYPINTLAEAEALDSFAGLPSESTQLAGKEGGAVAGGAVSTSVQVGANEFKLLDNRLSTVEANLKDQTDLINSELSLQKKTILGTLATLFGLAKLVPSYPISTIVVQGQPATLTTYSIVPQVQTGFDRLSATSLTLASDATINGVLTVKSGANLSSLSVSGNAGLTGNVTIGGTLGVTGDTTLGNLTLSGTLNASNSQFNLKNASTTNLTVSGNAWINQLTVTGTATTTFNNPIASQAGDFTIAGNNASNILLNPYGGNVGIGTTSPGSLLSVHSSGNVYFGGNLTVSGNSLFNNASTTNGTVTNFWSTNGTITNASSTYSTVSDTAWINKLNVTNTTSTSTISGGLTIGNNAALSVDRNAPVNSLFIDPSGNIGIGTTTPGNLLSVNSTGNVYFGGNLTVSGNSLFNNASTTNGTVTNFWSTNGTITNASSTYLTVGNNLWGNISQFTASVQTPLIWNNGTLTASTTGANPLIFATNSSERMRIDSTGNVGIGTTTPSAKLSIQGDEYLYGNLTVTGSGGIGANLTVTGQTFLADGTVAAPSLTFTSNTNTGIYRPGSNILGFTTNGSEKMRIDSNGNVAIGTTTTSYAQVNIANNLAVLGTASSSFNGIVQFNGVPSGTNVNQSSLYINPASSAAPANVLLGIAVNGSEKARINAEGDVQIVGYFTSSNTSATNQFSGGLSVLGNTTLGDATSDTVAFNGRITSSIVPSFDINYDIGTPSLRFNNIYANQIIATTTTAGGTASTTFIINNGNVTNDTQDSSLQFSRGTASPNAILKWDSVNKRFDFNAFPVNFQKNILVADTSSSTFSGPVWFTGTSQGTATSSAVVYINPSTAGVGYNLFDIAVAGNERFKVTGEGNTYIWGGLNVSNAITPLSADNAITIGGNLKITGNTIKDSSAATRLTIGATNEFTGNLNIASGNLSVNGNNFVVTSAGAASSTSLTVSGQTNLNNASSTNLTVSANLWANAMAISGTSTFNGNLLLKDGTATYPALAFTSDTNTGLYRISTGKMSFVTGGTDRLIMDSNGNIGLGTTTPNDSLDVYKSVAGQTRTSIINPNSQGYATLSLGTNSSGEANLNFYNSAYVASLLRNNLEITAAGSGNILIRPGGNTGIGSMFGSSIAPQATIDIGTSDAFNNTIVDEAILRHNTTATAGNGLGASLSFWGQDSSGSNQQLARIAGVVEQATTSSTFGSGLSFWTVGSTGIQEKMRINNSGNVGIGTTTPGNLLSVNSTGNVYFGGALTVSGNSLFNNATSTGLTVNGGTLLGSLVASNATFTTATTSALSVTGGSQFAAASFSGNVGIGTTSPITTFAVNGSGYFGVGLGVGILNTTANTLRVGQCVTGDTRLRRRRRKKNGGYEYDEVEIKNINPGDEILSLNEKTGQLEWQPVLALYDMAEQPVYKIKTSLGKTIRTTSSHPYLTKYGWIPVGDLREGDEIAVPKEEVLAAIGSALNLNRVNNNRTIFNIKRNPPIADTKAVSGGRKINEGFGPLEGILLFGVPIQFLFYALLNLFRKFADFTFAFGSKLNEPRHKDVYPKLSFVFILSKGINPFRFASSMPLTNSSAYFGLTGSRSSISSMSQPAGLTALEWYSSLVRRSTSASSIFESTSSSAKVSNIKSWGAPSRSRTTPARELFSSGKTDFGAKRSQDISRASDNFVGKSFFLAIRRNFNKWIKDLSNYGEDVKWDKIISIEYVGVERVWDISVKNTHNFVANGIIAHNTAFIVDSSGNVGIGTSTPGAKLHSLSAGTTQLRLGYDASNYNDFAVQNNGDLQVSTNGGSATLALTASGRVGIGTTTPGNLLSVHSSGNVYFGGALTVSGNSLFQNATTTGLTVNGGTLLGSLVASNATFTTATSSSMGTTGGAYFATLGAGNSMLANATTTGLSVNGGTLLGSLVAGAATTTSLSVTGGASFGAVNVTNLSALGNITAGNATTTGLTVNGGTLLGSLVASNATFTTATTSALSVTGGSQFAAASFSGNVGIGTTSPASTLDVRGTFRAGTPVTSTTNLEAQGIFYAASSAFNTSGSNLALVANDAAGAADVGPVLSFFAHGETGGNVNQQYAAIKGARVGADTGPNDARGYLAFATSIANSTVTEKMRILDNGNVGIGTTVPVNKLEVAGTIRPIAITDPTSGTGMELGYDPSSNRGVITAYDRSGSVYKNLHLNDVLYIKGGSTSGNVGIGTTGPGGKLQVNDATFYAEAYPTRSLGELAVVSTYAGTGSVIASFTNTNAAGGSQLMIYTPAQYVSGLQAIDYPVAGSVRSLVLNPEGGNVGIGTTDPAGYKLNIAGTGYLGAAAWVYSSDIRLKENISYLGNGLDKILQLKPARFDYIVGEKNQLGFIVQDVQGVIPEAVVVTDEKTGMLGLKTDFIIPYLVNSIKELASTTLALQNQFNALNQSLIQATSTLQAQQGTISLATISNDINLDGHSLLNVGSIYGLNGLWSIDSDGNITAKSVNTQALTVGGGNASGVTVYDRGTTQPKCVYVENDVIKISAGACGATQNSGTPAVIETASASTISETIPSPSATTTSTIIATSTPEIISGVATSTEPVVATATEPVVVSTTTISIATSTTP